MTTRYRSLLLALGLLFLTAASPPAAPPPKDGGAQRVPSSVEQTKSSLAEIASSLRQANEPSDLDQPCKFGEDNRKSELCAQWKAADAAQYAAVASKTFGIIGAIIGGLTLASAVAAAIYAAKAAKHTETAANAANDANRAWITPVNVVTVLVKDSQVDGDIVRDSLGFIVKWQNSGASPALDLQSRRVFHVVDAGATIESVPITFDPFDEHSHTSISGPGSIHESGVCILSDEQANAFRKGKVKIFLDSGVYYRHIYSSKNTDPCITTVRFEVTHRGGIIINESGQRQEATSIDLTQCNAT